MTNPIVIEHTPHDSTGRPDWCKGQLESVITKAIDRGLGVTYSNKGHFKLFEVDAETKVSKTLWEGEMERTGGGWILE